MAWLFTCLQKASFISALFISLSVQAQNAPEFKKAQIKLSGQTINVELAENDRQRSYGLMFRNSLPENSGMLFIFEGEQQLSFWMKNTFIDLSIGYFDKNRTLVDVQEMKKTAVMSVNLPSYPSKKPAKYALEMNKGWFAKHKIKLGAQFDFVSAPKSGSKKTQPPATN